MKTLKIKVFGTVQGVYYRATTKVVADHLGIKGLVKNLPDGSVYIEAQGEGFLMDEFLDYCRQGPEKAVVERIEQEEIDVEPFKNFEVLKK